MHKTLILSLLVVMFAVPASAATYINSEKFQLYTQCSPVKLLVEELSEDAEALGLKKKKIINLVESRLRSARIYDEKSSSYLYMYE